MIDTKLKNIGNFKPSTQDLWQMYMYNDYGVKSMLLYPATETVTPEFKIFKDMEHKCAVGSLNIIENGKLKGDIGKEILGWCY